VLEGVADQVLQHAAGVTAAFNKNLPLRINRELQGDFDPDAFQHVALRRRTAAHRDARGVHTAAARQRARPRLSLHGRRVDPHRERVQAQASQFLAMAHRAGWRHEQLWFEGAAGYAVHVLKSVSSA
jgi:L-histidine Nalpha-methyltransferase